MTFRRILLKAAAKKRKALEALLEQVPILKEITVSFSLYSLGVQTVYLYFKMIITLNPNI